MAKKNKANKCLDFVKDKDVFTESVQFTFDGGDK